LIIHPHKENVLPEADQVYLSPSYTDWKWNIHNTSLPEENKYDAMGKCRDTHARTRARTHARSRTRTHAHAHARVRTHAHTHTRTRPHVRPHVRTRARARTHTHTHTHTHTQSTLYSCSKCDIICV
jgi:hypothetical protein